MGYSGAPAILDRISEGEADEVGEQALRVGSSEARYRVGIDIGGTFTDLILADDVSGGLRVGKVLTTPSDPSLAVERGLADLLAEAELEGAELRNVIHGTTLVTNAIIERKGARTGLLTTQGFRDAVQIGRESRYDMYDIFLDLPEPLVRRRHRLGVPERVLDDGSVVEPLDVGAAEEAIRALQAEGIEAIAVCFLHSFKNPAHERAVGELIQKLAPEARVSLSCEVAPEIREYERASTTICNVYVQPLVERYLGHIGERLGKLGYQRELLIMLSSGGTATVDTARRFPIRLVESGPAAGALAAAFYGQQAGYPNLLSFDMGGTTAKACLIDDGEPLTTPEFEVARLYRFKKGSGMPVKVPVIELIEIGAGGGSIARVDELGLLKVGPDSAGADPGPVCYGQGGTEPTVTDADLVLGYLDPTFFLGGKMRLDRAAAERAIVERIAQPLGLDPIRAAWGIHEVVNENMAAAARIHAIERGKDARAYPLFAYGGAGPAHAHRVGQILGVERILVPLGAGATSAMGFLVAPLAFDFVRSAYAPLDAPSWDEINELLDAMEREGRELMRRAGVPDEQVEVRRSADIRYVNQGHEINTPAPSGVLSDASRSTIQASFEALYQRLYNRLIAEAPLEITGWRLQVSGPRPEVTLTGSTTDGRGDAAPDGQGASSTNAASVGRQPSSVAAKGERPAYFPERGGFTPTPVYDRYALGPGASGTGPAIFEERESTAIVGPGAAWSVDEQLNLVVVMRTGD